MAVQEFLEQVQAEVREQKAMARFDENAQKAFYLNDVLWRQTEQETREQTEMAPQLRPRIQRNMANDIGIEEAALWACKPDCGWWEAWVRRYWQIVYLNDVPGRRVVMERVECKLMREQDRSAIPGEPIHLLHWRHRQKHWQVMGKSLNTLTDCTIVNHEINHHLEEYFLVFISEGVTRVFYGFPFWEAKLGLFPERKYQKSPDFSGSCKRW